MAIGKQKTRKITSQTAFGQRKRPLSIPTLQLGQTPLDRTIANPPLICCGPRSYRLNEKGLVPLVQLHRPIGVVQELLPTGVFIQTKAEVDQR